MKISSLKPRKALNKAFLKVKPNRTEIECFKTNLIQLLDRTNDTESEEFHKNLVIDFLKKTYYDPNHFINTKGRNDLVIHNGDKAKSTVGVILEAKKPTNKAEMVSIEKLNTKAFQELMLYYLRERITHKNLEVKHLVITNINEWFIFDATTFDRLFAQNKNLVKQFTDFEGGRLADSKTDFFYKQIAEPFIAEITSEIEFAYFNIQDYQKPLRNADKADDNKLIALFKLLSPEHLLKLPFTNDSNSLDKRFYSELLHIIGLTETKEGGKKLIGRNKESERNTGSILEDAIIQLDSLDKLSRLDKPSQFGNTQQERLFNVALELSITWVNRILFLKLLEAQLITYHKGDKSYSFLNFDKIKNYDDLNSLFFQVLARKYEDRNPDVKQIFEKVPYLNSSLFEPTEIEQVTLFISNLRDDKSIPIISSTVLKNDQGKKRTGKLSTLEYLFEFLNAYDFSSEGSEEIQEDNKTLINASVLGLIFEKINGYKDGSFFTPGFITMYMCRETIRKAVIQKFNQASSLTPLSQVAEGATKTPLLRGVGGVSSSNRISSSNSVSSSKTESSSNRNPSSVPKRQIIPYNPKLKELARKLRNESTKSEIQLWGALKGKFEGKYDFHRQKPLDNYIADFFCHELSLVVEIDGDTHNWQESQQRDYEKEARFNELGLNVLRFIDSDVFDHFESTVETIREYVKAFEKGDFSSLVYEDSPLNSLTGDLVEGMRLHSYSGEDTPLNPLSREDFQGEEDTPLNPLSRGDFQEKSLSKGEFKTLDDVYDQIGEGRMFTRKQANEIVNSIKICDPAVGSGHFLVSALNEMIAVKNDLKILEDREGKSLHRYEVEVVNDELIVTDVEGELFEYNSNNKESQRIQETLFHEKQNIIENCLFGVDINPNSVKICRLRLWIELLKNAYYLNLHDGSGRGHTPGPSQEGSMGEAFGSSREGSKGNASANTWERSKGIRMAGGFRELQTLPNIDINIKCGNSLVSRFAIDADLSQALKKSKFSIDGYRIAVDRYRNAENKEEKREMERLIAEIKSDFRSEIANNDPKLKRKAKLGGELYNLTMQTGLFEESAKEKKERKKRVEKIETELEKLSQEIEEIKSNKIFENAFEWRFEFPEVLNEQGDFVGFDVVIGNPPYGRYLDIDEKIKGHLKSRNIYGPTGDIAEFFIRMVSSSLLRKDYTFSFIVPKGLSYVSSWRETRNILLEKVFVNQVIDTGRSFDEAAYEMMIFVATNKRSKLIKAGSISENHFESTFLNVEIYKNGIFFFGIPKNSLSIAEKIISNSSPVSNYFEYWYGKGGMTPKINKVGRGYKVLTGKEIQRLFIKNIDDKWFLEEKHLSEKDIERANIKKVVVQDIVAHITKPLPHIKLTATIDRQNQFCLNTVMCFSEKSILSNEFLVGLINSRLMSFFFYYFIYNQAIRTMHFMPGYADKLPIPNKLENASLIGEIVNTIINLKKTNHLTDTTELENQIDQLVYELYGLNEEEINIIENK
ncbi:Eco57I restriction-modification methylase domain-containing protein [Fulvivirgaceae bacterium LMO-SS25]